MNELELAWEVGVKMYGNYMELLTSRDDFEWYRGDKQCEIKVYVDDTNVCTVFAVWGRGAKDKCLIDAFISTFKPPGIYTYFSNADFIDEWKEAQGIAYNP